MGTALPAGPCSCANIKMLLYGGLSGTQARCAGYPQHQQPCSLSLQVSRHHDWRAAAAVTSKPVGCIC